MVFVVFVLGEAREEGLRPESPDVGRGDDEGADRFVVVDFFQAQRERV